MEKSHKEISDGPRSKMQNGNKSAKSRSTSGRRSPTKSISGSDKSVPPTSGLDKSAKRTPLPQGGAALHNPSRTSMVTSGAQKPPVRAPRLSLHAMTLALSMTRRVKQQVLLKRQEKANRALEPTYRLEPQDRDRFRVPAIEEIISETLEKVLRDKTYEAKSASKQACLVSNVINTRLKELRMPRYKTVCHVIVGETSGADVGEVSRCLWDPKTDTYASASYTNGSIHGTATVYGIYFD